MTVRLDRFMASANTAYYANRDPFADFTTAPEITQAFGEVLGAWCAVTWDTMGRPDPVTLAELGPGRGTLMADLLRGIRRAAPGFAGSARVHLVETSPRLRAAQAAVIPAATWHDQAEHLPPGPMLLLANEFLDALPIRQFLRRDGHWLERHVADGAWVDLPTPGPAQPAPDGTLLEHGQAALDVVRAVADHVVADGGAALFLDYGPAVSEPGSSLQALRGGRPADPLADPGSADLTAHVDFSACADEARAAGAAVHGPEAQGVFLTRLGLFQRTSRLAQGLPPARALGLMQAAERLTGHAWMGRLFKALCLTHPALPQPPGFADAC